MHNLVPMQITVGMPEKVSDAMWQTSNADFGKSPTCTTCDFFFVAHGSSCLISGCY